MTKIDNNQTPDSEITTYDTKNLGKLVEQWTKKNNTLSIQKRYALKARSFGEELKSCLSSQDTNFETGKLFEEINNLGIEICFGDIIISNLDKLLSKEKDPEILQIKQRITTSVEMLKKNATTLHSFLEKIESLPEHKKDIKKYETEIATLFEIL